MSFIVNLYTGYDVAGDSYTETDPKNFRARDTVECSNVFLSAGNNPGVLKNSTEHAGTLFIAFRQFPQVNSTQLTTTYWTSRPGLQYKALAFGFDTGHSSAFEHLSC